MEDDFPIFLVLVIAIIPPIIFLVKYFWKKPVWFGIGILLGCDCGYNIFRSILMKYYFEMESDSSFLQFWGYIILYLSNKKCAKIDAMPRVFLNVKVCV